MTLGGQPSGEAVALNPDAYAAQIAVTLQELNAYGPVMVRTRVQDLPTGEHLTYDNPLPRDPDRRPIARIGHHALHIANKDGQVAVRVRGEGPELIDLPLGDIATVGVDHPHGNYMPLSGQRMLKLGLSQIGGLAVLRWVSHAIEYSARQVLEAGPHPEMKGIHVVRAYDVTETDIRDLDAAKAHDATPAIFLLSHGYKYGGIGHEYGVITSRMGYGFDSVVTVRPPNDSSRVPLRHVEMVDYGRDISYDALLRGHIGRMHELNPAYRFDVPSASQMRADALFLYAAHD